MQRSRFIVLSAALTLGPLSAALTGDAVHGVRLADMDLTVSPRVDFNRYASGGWLARTEIPADRGEYSTFDEVFDRTENTQLDLLGALAAQADLRAGSDEWKAVQFFKQGTNQRTRDAQGVTPLRPVLAQIDAIHDLRSLHAFLAGSIFKGVPGLFTLAVVPDLKNSGVYAAYLGGPQLGLPNRDYYLQDDAQNAALREAYDRRNAAMLGFLGYDAARAGEAARNIYALERRLAEQTLTREQQQDLNNLYHPMTVEQLAGVYPLTDWGAYLAAHDLGAARQVVVTETKYLQALPGIVRGTPLATLKDYLKLQLINAYQTSLSGDVERVAFDFGRLLSGQREQRPLQERVLTLLDGTMGDAVGRLYVARAFPPEAKAQIEELTQNVTAAFRVRLQNNTWMTDATKARALEKLARLRVKVGYPNEWRSYAAVNIGPSYADTAASAGNAEYRRTLAKFGQRVNRDEWATPPQTVNAYYNPLNNEIIFPAGFLQAPFFDYQADPASNYGAIGMVIGHEITHGFDISGSRFDADGNLSDWWTPEDRARFEALNRRAAEQYGAIEVLPGVRVNGQLTVGENVADMGGLQVAYDALQVHLREHGDPGSIDGLSQAQRFFIAAASIWRAKTSDAYLQNQVRIDVHSPASVRATQPMRNMNAFHEVFGTRPGDPMFLAPDQRLVIW